MAKAKSKTKKATRKDRKTKPAEQPVEVSRPDKKEELVVFAIRLPKADRDLIHEAAGPRRATRFVRSVALAAAKGDEQGFREILAEHNVSSI